MRYLLALFLAAILIFADLNSQEKDTLAEYLQFNEVASFEFLYTYFPSFFIQNTLELKQFIRSKKFRQVRNRYGDIKAVDAIFIRAMALTKENTAMSLFLSTVACFDHRLVGLKVPVFSLFFPLTNESDSEFGRRVGNLPVRLYEDTPVSKTGDRDKLQHFFGSAFISFIFESDQSAERVAQFIEFGEDAFIVDGAYDQRDLRANCQGGEFGLALLENNHRLPSEFLREYCGSDSTGITDIIEP